MKIFRFEVVQNFQSEREKIWEFISEPHNLNIITPPDMQFKILSGAKPGEKMYAGQIITYTVRPLFHLPVTWVTEITHVREGWYFVDEQRFGPYLFWHHQHILEEIYGGICMRDVIHYALPRFLVFPELFDNIIVRRRLMKIFSYRFQILENKFASSISKHETVRY